MLGPHLFILFINDILECVNSTTRLFADDCINYKPVTSREDEISFQNDLNNLVSWSNQWGMRFNPSKCKVMRISRKRHPGNTAYTMFGEVLGEVQEYKYLGVILQNNLKWDKQTHHAAIKATKVLNFLRRNFHHCSKTVKENLYTTFLQPHLEYASPAWNPGTKANQEILQKVQRRAARFVTSDYKPKSSVTDMLSKLKWDSMEQRRINQRLSTLFKMINDEIDVNLDRYIKSKVNRSRRSHNITGNTKPCIIHQLLIHSLFLLKP